ncbi:hypothetical protein [Roseibacillus ishigakijimensis]|nr:hypothetical protein [Roseibacillus ishigakijimensis]
MLILLSLIAVGLLSLSSTVLRSSAAVMDEQVARANARMALQMAIGQLQKYVGDDRRITMAADQKPASGDGSEPAAEEGYRYWTGVYESWDDTLETRPSPRHLAWLVSSPERGGAAENRPYSPQSAARSINLVGEGTVGENDVHFVEAPVITVGAEQQGGIAWWTGDQGMKAAVALPEKEPAGGLAEIRREHQTASNAALEFVTFGDDSVFEDFEPSDPRVAAMTGWGQFEFVSSSEAAHDGLFHDMAARSTGLLTNVRQGGFRKDLSMFLEVNTRSRRPNFPMEPLYRVGREDGINFEELSTYYNLYKELGSGRSRYTTGGSVPGGAPALTMERGPAAARNDYFHHYKQPTILSYQAVFSLEARPASGQRDTYDLYLVIDPILTLWNPHDVPIVLPQGSAYMTVKYFGMPYDLDVTVNGRRYRCPIMSSLSTSDSNYLSLTVGQEDPLAFKPGEVIKFSQSGDEQAKLTGYGSNRHKLAGRSGFNFGGGVALLLKNDANQTVTAPRGAEIIYRARPNNLTAGARNGAGNVLAGYSTHTRHFSTTHHEVYIGDDRGSNSLGVGGMYVDYDFGNQRLKRGESRNENTPGTKPPRERLYANRFPDVFETLDEDDTRALNVGQLAVEKAPIMMYSYYVKTEEANDRGSRSFMRFNPKAHHVDFYDLSEEELDRMPYEIKVEALNSWTNRNLETSESGAGFFGGGYRSSSGSNYVVTHSIPREPLASIAALQHSAANGFLHQQPTYGYAALNAREPLLPQISHAIGNSYAPAVLSPSETERTISGRRALADHSYLANRALWDDWFFSTIAPEDADGFSRKRSQQEVAQQFLEGEEPLSNVRYQPNLGDFEPSEVLSQLFDGSNATDEAVGKVAAYMSVDGLFNVNSTSVMAWKALLGALNGSQVTTRDESGEVSPRDSRGGVPVPGLLVPADEVADGRTGQPLFDSAQWNGRRVLSEDEIEALAEGIVREVRKRGPFLSLADFVNRRVGNDDDLARAGAIQAALDSDQVGLNAAFENRSVLGATASRMAFPAAEDGPISTGIPGIIKQADILTPIGPLLTVRSDTFIVRAYGESRGPNGQVRAQAWCEAQVQREADYLVKEADERDELPDDLSNRLNQTFGRRLKVLSFRWLNPAEV